MTPTFWLDAWRWLWRAMRSTRTRPTGLLKNARRALIAARISAHRPRCVFSVIDNSAFFHWLCGATRDTGLRFIAVQNGNRLEQDFDESGRRHAVHDVYIGFGEHDRRLLASFGHEVGTFRPAGALFADCFREAEPDEPEPAYDIGVVSSWQGDLEYTPDRIAMFENADRMHRLVAGFARQTGRQVAVFMSTNAEGGYGPTRRYGDERTYLRGIYADAATLVERVRFGTYRGMRRSRVVVGFMTTAVREAYGFGKKVVYCDFSGSARFSPYRDLILWTRDDPTAFAAHLSGLLDEPQAAYDRRNAAYRRELMAFPTPRRTQDVVRDELLAACGRTA